MENNLSQNYTQERGKLSVCVAPGCKNNSINNEKVKFHSFPRSQVGKLWHAALGTVASSSSVMSVVCNEHFSREDFTEDVCVRGNVEHIRRTLKRDAVPSVVTSQSTQTCPLLQGGNKRLKGKEAGDTKRKSSEVVKLYRRDDKALGVLTQRFMQMLKSSPNGLLDVHQAAIQLNISKRRIYDITNVLEGVLLLKKKSSRFFQWMGPEPEIIDDRLGCLVTAENKLDDLIRSTKQQIQDMTRNTVNYKLAYLTYDDIQRIPIFEDQAVFVVKAPPETTLEVAHPKEAFQMHIISKKGPVNVLGCTDNVNVMQSKSKYCDWDYSYLPLRGYSTANTSCKDNANQKTKCSNIFNSSSEPTQQQTQVPISSTFPEPTSVLPPQEVQNCSSPDLPLSIIIKEEDTDVDITPDEALNEDVSPPGHESDQLSSDVHMTDV